MDSCDGAFEHRWIDPDAVNWGRVMVIYRILTLNHSFNEGGKGEGSDRSSGDLQERYFEWLAENYGDVEFELASRILFHMSVENPLAGLEKWLGPDDDENQTVEEIVETDYRKASNL